MAEPIQMFVPPSHIIYVCVCRKANSPKSFSAVVVFVSSARPLSTTHESLSSHTCLLDDFAIIMFLRCFLFPLVSRFEDCRTYDRCNMDGHCRSNSTGQSLCSFCEMRLASLPRESAFSGKCDSPCMYGALLKVKESFMVEMYIYAGLYMHYARG
jgi:hypothetical protein